MFAIAPPAARATTPPRLLEEAVSKTAPNLAEEEAIFRDSSDPPARAEATTVDRRIASGAITGARDPARARGVVRDVDLLTSLVRPPPRLPPQRAAWVDKLPDCVVTAIVRVCPLRCGVSQRKRADERRRGREGPKTPSTPVSLSARRSAVDAVGATNDARFPTRYRSSSFSGGWSSSVFFALPHTSAARTSTAAAAAFTRG